VDTLVSEKQRSTIFKDISLGNWISDIPIKMYSFRVTYTAVCVSQPSGGAKTQIYNRNYLHCLGADSLQTGSTAAILRNGYCCLKSRLARALCVWDFQYDIKAREATHYVCAMFSTDCLEENCIYPCVSSNDRTFPLNGCRLNVILNGTQVFYVQFWNVSLNVGYIKAFCALFWAILIHG